MKSIAGILFSVLLGACLHGRAKVSQVAQPYPPATALALPGAVIQPQADSLSGYEIYDDELLLHLGLEAARAGENDKALLLYARLAATFPASTLISTARFNSGLLFEQKNDFAAAREHYEQILRSFAQDPTQVDDRLAIDTHFRVAVCAVKLHDYWAAVTRFDHILELPGLAEGEHLEALVGRGLAMFEAAEFAAAETALVKALHYYREVMEPRRLPDNGLAAEAAFHLGAIHTQYFSEVVLQFPPDLLAQRLERKCEELLTAQRHYLQAIRYGDTHTVAAAGFKIGNLYETLYEVLMALPVPPELDVEQTQSYEEEVRNRLSTLVKKAIRVYEKSLLIGRAAPSAQDWVQNLNAALGRLKAIFLAAHDEGAVLNPSN